MRWLKTLLVGVLCIVVVFVGMQFTFHNTDKVAIDLVFMQLPEMSLSLWLIAAFGLGGLMGVVLSVGTVVLLRTRLGSVRRRMTTAQKELDQLRTAALKDAA